MLHFSIFTTLALIVISGGVGALWVAITAHYRIDKAESEANALRSKVFGLEARIESAYFMLRAANDMPTKAACLARIGYAMRVLASSAIDLDVGKPHGDVSPEQVLNNAKG